MAALPIAGAGLGEPLRFGNATLENRAHTIAPVGVPEPAIPRHGIYRMGESAAALYFEFTEDQTSPVGSSASFRFGSNKIQLHPATSAPFTRWGTPSAKLLDIQLLPLGCTKESLGEVRLRDSNQVAGQLDLTFDRSVTTTPSSLNTAFIFGGAQVIAGVGLGDMARSIGPEAIDQPLQLWAQGFEAGSTLGRPRAADQPDLDFDFDSEAQALWAGNTAFYFGERASTPCSASGFSATSFGTTRFANRARLIQPAPIAAKPLKNTRIYYPTDRSANLNFGLVQNYKTPTPLNTPFYFQWANFMLGEGWESLEFDQTDPEVWLYHRWLTTSGIEETVFGQSQLENWAEFAATPYGIWPAGIGLHKLEIAPRYQGNLTAVLPSLGELNGTGSYKSYTSRPTVSATNAPWQIAGKNSLQAAHKQQISAKQNSGWQSHWSLANSLAGNFEHFLPADLATHTLHKTSVVAQPTAIHLLQHFAQQDALNRWLHRDSSHQAANKLGHLTKQLQQDAIRAIRGNQRSRWQVASSHQFDLHDYYQPATSKQLGWMGRFQHGRPPPPNTTNPGEPSNDSRPEQADHCYSRSTTLVFAFTKPTTELIYLCDAVSLPPPIGSSVIIPVKRIYIVLNNVNLVRADDQLEIPVYSFSLSLDSDSWAWGFEASLPARAQKLIEPTGAGPTELIANINGKTFRVLAEQIARDRVFGESRLRVNGRSKHALLDAPYAPILSFRNAQDRTHRQLFNDVLQINGVPIEWDIEYALEDWNVPSGVFNHQGTYISALASLARAGGAYLLPSPNLSAFKVAPYYPAAPWNWGDITPDFILPESIVSREAIAWRTKPDYNRVFVSGEGLGVLGQITRGGSAGDLIAPMVTDSLITSAAAARQRGLAILSDTGPKLEAGLKLPVTTDTGIIQPGAFIQYENEGLTSLGLVRSTRIDASLPDVYQTLGVECHA